MTGLLKTLGQLPEAERPAAGAEINRAKKKLEGALQNRKRALEQIEAEAAAAANAIDVTLPARGVAQGSLHPVSIVLDRIEQFFHSVGFDSVRGPEIEDDYHNFEALKLAGAPSGEGHARYILCDGQFVAADTYVTRSSENDGIS